MNLEIGIGIQTVDKNTPATSFTKLRCTDSTLSPDFNRVDSAAFSSSGYLPDSYISTAAATGTLTFELTPETLKLLLPAMGYKMRGSSVETLAGLTFTDEGIANGVGKPTEYYTILELNHEDDEERTIVGAQFSNVVFDVTKSQYVTMQVDVLGWYVDYQNAITTPAITVIADYNKPLTCVNAFFVLNGDDVSRDTASSTLTINNNLENRFGLGTRDATNRVRSGYIEAILANSLSAYKKDEFERSWNALMKDDDSLHSILKLTTGQDSGEAAIGIFMHRMKVNSTEMTNKSAEGGLDEEFNVLNDEARKTPITFAFGTVD